MFDRYIGIDYSGAQTPRSRLKGLRVYDANPPSLPIERRPDCSEPRRHWTRQGIALWLREQLLSRNRCLIGIDHGFSFPREYFVRHELPKDWPRFLDDFCAHWPTDGDAVRVEDVRRGLVGNGTARDGNTRWRRLTEQRAGGAKSVFVFDVPGSVAKSTHAGLPWLRYLRTQVRERLHFWPFDGWSIPNGYSVIAEVYPSLWRQCYAQSGRSDDQHDAYVVAARMCDADRQGELAGFFNPPMDDESIESARYEGWILGVT